MCSGRDTHDIKHNEFIKEISEVIINFDHSYEYSDDMSVYLKWRAREKEVMSLTENLSIHQKNEILDECIKSYNSWNYGKRNWETDEDQFYQNKMKRLCGL